MCTAASDTRDRPQGLDSASHAALCFTDIPVGRAFSCHSSPLLNLDFFPPQPDVGPTFFSPETFPFECWQPSSSPVPAIQTTNVASYPYPDVSACSTSVQSSLSDVSACMSLPPSSMQQFYFSPVPLDNSIPRVSNQLLFSQYQSDKPTPEDPASHLFLPHDSPTDFTSRSCSTADDPWLTLPTSTTATTTTPATDYLTSQSPCLPLSSPAISTTTTVSSSPTSSTLTLDYPQFHHTLPPTPHPHLQSTPSATCATDLTSYGIPTSDGTWRCAHPGCTSSAVFRRGCDLRKHFNRHRKHLFCRHEGCPQSMQGGFSSKKDRARHEAKHNPGIGCEWEGCGRVFSRVDNMKDHVRRIHRKREGR